jgi:RNA polymerase sigma-70 factor (ECF subfamily)
MQSLSDISLVAQVAVFHNRRAFDQLVRKYQSPVRRFLLNLTLGNEALSDDLAQDTFIRAYTHITQFQGIASFQTWLFRIAYNVYYDEKRKEKGIVKSEKFTTATQFPAEKTSAEANSSLFTSNGYPLSPRHPQGGRASLRDPTAHRWLFARRDSQDDRYAGEYGEVALATW